MADKSATKEKKAPPKKHQRKPRTAMVKKDDGPSVELELAREIDVRTDAFWAPRRAEIIKAQFAPKTDWDQFSIYMDICRMRNLNPIANQIYCVIRPTKVKEGKTERWENRMCMQVSIDGFRLISERTGKYRGQTPPEWWDPYKMKCKVAQIKELKEAGLIGPDDMVNDDSGDSEKKTLKQDEVYISGWVRVWTKKYLPAASRVGVYKEGAQEPFWGVARYAEYVQISNGEPTAMWRKMPTTMLAKCAEALAHRKANPQELSGFYSHEEMPDTAQIPSGPAVDKIREDYEKTLTKACQKMYIAGTKAGGNHEKIMGWLRERYGVKDSAKELSLEQLKEATLILEKKAEKQGTATRRGLPAAKGEKDGEKKNS